MPTPGKPIEPLPDIWYTKDGKAFNPNAPTPIKHEPPTDRRPVKLLEAEGFSSAEDWGNAILAKRNGKALDNRPPVC